MSLEQLEIHESHSGKLVVYRHDSHQTKTPMTFSIFLPAQAERGEKLPVVWYLSGLTCTHANVTEKGDYRRTCAELGLIFIAPDTSPRGDGVPDDAAYDFGQGAGFYVDATEAPFADNYRMYSYITEELPALIAANFPVDMTRQSILGHSMGGHGALVVALRNPVYRAVSAFSPIVAPSQVPWGERAFTGYLGPDRAAWASYDACALIAAGHRVPDILIDQGKADSFLTSQLKPELLQAACDVAGLSLTLRLHTCYDHSYYFISSFMDDHLRWHAARF